MKTTKSRFSRYTNQQRKSSQTHFGQCTKECQIVFECLAKSEPWIKHKAVIANTRQPASINSFGQRSPHL